MDVKEVKDWWPNVLMHHQDWIKGMSKEAQVGIWVTAWTYTAGGFVWCDRSFYLVKWPQKKWACDFHDDATSLSFQLQLTEDFF